MENFWSYRAHKAKQDLFTSKMQNKFEKDTWKTFF